MSIIDLAIRRPVATACVILGLVLLGINAYRQMPLELLPKVDVPYVTVVTVYPGASPEEIELDVAKRIEDAVVTIEGLKHVSSACMENAVVTLLEFELDVDVDRAANDVREKLNLIRSELPADVEEPRIEKFDINAKPIATIALSGSVPLDELYDYADQKLRDRLTTIEGVAGIQIVGGAPREVHVLLDRQKLAARNSTSLEVVETLRRALGTIPSGRIQEGSTEFSVKFDADFRSFSELANLEIVNKEGRRCYLRDVGGVVMGTSEVRQLATLNGEPCVAIKVIKKADANAVRVTRNVREAVERLGAVLPEGMRVAWVVDDGRFIEAINRSAWQDVALGIVLTAFILFAFLYNWRALIVVATSMPVTVLIALFFMQLTGYTLNTSTLIAIGLSVGVLVTNSLVVLEAILGRLERLGDPMKAARIGAREVAVAVLASAATNAVVLFPLAAMPTKVGRFIGPLAMTMFWMTVVSLFISFTLTPMLCSRLLKKSFGEKRGLISLAERGFNRGFQAVVSGYRWLLGGLRRRYLAALVVLGAVGLLVHSLWVAQRIGTGAFADPDLGQIFVRLEFPTHYNLQQTAALVRDAERRLRDLPELRNLLSTVGKVEAILGQSSEGVYLAQLLLVFSDRDQRDVTIKTLLDEVRRRLAGLPDAAITVSQPAVIGGQSYPVELEIAGEDLKMLDELTLRTLKLAQGIPGILDPDTTVRPPKPQLRVIPRRDVLGDRRSPAVGLGLTLRANLEGLKAGTFKMDSRNYDLVVKLASQSGSEQVEQFLLPGNPGQPVVLTSMAKVVEDSIPIQIFRKDKERVTKLTAQLAPELPLGLAAQKISQAIEEQGNFPPGYSYKFTGIYEVMTEGLSGLLEAGILALLLVYLCLAAIVESFRRPFLVLATIPLALIGTFWALALAGESLSIFATMGIVIMAGIVVNNAILVVDRLTSLLEEKVSPDEAILTASCERLRPQLMITLAAVMGMLPMALSQGLGAELRNGVGIASSGGILVSGLLTLIVVPSIYLLFQRRTGVQREEMKELAEALPAAPLAEA